MTVMISTIVTDVEEIIGEAAGASVQVYDDSQLGKIVVRAFSLLFKRFFWPEYSSWVSGTVDGTNGYLDDSGVVLAALHSPEDIKYVKYGGKQRNINRLPKHRNPNTITGSRALYWSWLPQSTVAGQTNKIKFWPVTAVDDVDIYFRSYPYDATATTTPIDEVTDLDQDTVLYLDKDLLTYATVFLSLTGNDLNPTAAGTYQGLMEQRYNDLITTLGNHDVEVSREYDIPTTWQEDWY